MQQASITWTNDVQGLWHHMASLVRKNATVPHKSEVNIGSGKGLKPSGNKPLTKLVLTQFYVIWCH